MVERLDSDLVMSHKYKIMMLLALALIFYTVAYDVDVSVTGLATSVATNFDTTNNIEITFNPQNPKISEKTTIETTVRTQERGSFLLEVIIVEEGRTQKFKEYQFSSDPGDRNTFTFDYVPASIKPQNIIANMYSSNKNVLYGSKVVDFKAENDIGPFDIEFDLPTNFVKQGENLPINVKMINFGLKGTDVQLIVRLDCLNKPDIEQSSFLFVNHSSDLEKNFIMPTCGELGQHGIRASLYVYDVEYVFATSQYFERTNLEKVDFLVPTNIEVKAGESQKLNIVYQNKGKDLTDVRPLVFGISREWFKITPTFIPEIKTGETAVAIVEFNVPEDRAGSYPILMGISGDNLFSQRASELVVLEGEKSGIDIRPSLPGLPGIRTILVVIIVIAAIGIIVYFVRSRRRAPTFSHKLRRIKRWV